MAECQRRVHDLIDLQLCSAGVEAAIKAHDYETGMSTTCFTISIYSIEFQSETQFINLSQTGY